VRVLTTVVDSVELKLTERAIREATGSTYSIDLGVLDQGSLVELRRMVRDLHSQIEGLKARVRINR
jgi:hypothetical protein